MTTKIHAVVDALGLPVKLALSKGQTYDGHQARTLLSDLLLQAMVLADRTYDADAIRTLIADQDTWAYILSMPHRHTNPVFSKHLLEYATWSSGSSTTQTLPRRRNAIR